MIKMKHCYLFYFLLLLSCSDKKETISQKLMYQEGFAESRTENPAFAQGNRNSVAIHKIGKYIYRAKFLSALEFLEKKREKIAAEDREDLVREGVLILEIQTPEQTKDFFEDPGCLMDKETAYSYLSGEISGDITIIQGQEEITPVGSGFERSPEGPNHLRVLFFLGKMDLSLPFSVRYNDRLTGQGMIKFQLNKNTN